MASKMSERLNFKSVEELLGVVNEEAAMDIEIYKISGFKGHPFKVVDDEKMQELVESIKVNGVLSPVMIRPTGMDTYEMISGHRRLHGEVSLWNFSIFINKKAVHNHRTVFLLLDML